MPFQEVKHPLIQHKLGLLRKKKTSSASFRQLVNEISMLMAFEATRDLPLREVEIETPLEETTANEIAGKKLVLLPILRAGLGMVDGILDLIPNARVGHIGLYRNEETLEPEFYFFKVPKSTDKRSVFLLDPMLATGGSANYAIEKVKKEGFSNIYFLCLVASPEGVAKVENKHPDVKIFTASLDRELNKNGYILPGLGDAGDRIFGTK